MDRQQGNAPQGYLSKEHLKRREEQEQRHKGSGKPVSLRFGKEAEGASKRK